MRKIKSEQEIAKKQKKNQLILGIIMILLLVGSVAGFSLMSQNTNDSSKVEELGLEFIHENGVWKTLVGSDVFAFQNLPSEVSNISVEINLTLGNYANQPVYLVNPNQGMQEISTNMGRYIQRFNEACLTQENCTKDVPTKDCSNNIIIFKAGNETKVYSKNNCVYIIGDFVKATDAFLYKILGISQ